ncbi:MAG: hypothetical protein RL648_1212, partial [Verrucomicrobiota bacterium]|jgi:hypothetical protein
MEDVEKEGRSGQMRQARVLLVVSVMALLVGPVVMLLGALSTNVLLMGTVLLIMGALGLFAGMRQISRQ